MLLTPVSFRPSPVFVYDMPHTSLLYDLEKRRLGVAKQPLCENFAGADCTMQRMRLAGLLEGHTGCVNTCTFSHDGRHCVTVSTLL
jgi:hypothetical protein